MRQQKCMPTQPVTDVVLTWVDSADPKWQKQRLLYCPSDEANNPFVGGENRYTDNGLLRYVFRGIEKFMPWVRMIHFVTYGHTPKWLQKDNPKLHIVRHKDFISGQYLPTFNSNAILLNLHRIPDLAEQFVFFNDDMFAVRPCKNTDFFKKGLPCDMAVMNPIAAPDSDPFWDMMINNVMTINKHYSKKKCIHAHPLKWYSPRYGFKSVFRNLSLSGFRFFPGFYDCHLPNAYLKSSFAEYWEANKAICEDTCSHKFRNSEDITEWAIRYWQLAKGAFCPVNKSKMGAYVSLKDGSANIFFQKTSFKLLCINDECDAKSLEPFVQRFEQLFPEKSSFEL